MSKITPLDSPVNASEKYLYGINLRLEALIDQVSSLVEYISKKDSVAVESKQVDVKPVAQQEKPRSKRGG